MANNQQQGGLQPGGHAAGAAQGGGQAGQPRIQLKIFPYTHSKGDEWLTWKHHFFHVVELNGYDDRAKRLALAASMRNRAACTTLDVDVLNENRTFEQVLQLFENRFMPAAESELARTAFERAQQGPHEDILDWHARLRSLYFRAYPDQRHVSQLVRRFAQGIRKREIRLQVMRANCQTYPESLEVAQRETAVMAHFMGQDINIAAAAPDSNLDVGGGVEPMEIGALGRPRYQNNFGARPRDSGGRYSNPAGRGPPKENCHFCDKPGHWKNECHLLKKARRFIQSTRGGADRNNDRRPSFPNNGGNQRKGFIAALTAALEEDGDDADFDPDQLLDALGQNHDDGEKDETHDTPPDF